MHVDAEIFQRLANTDDAFLSMAYRHHGDEGAQAIRAVMAAAIEAYRYVDLRQAHGQVVIFQQVDDTEPALSGSPSDVSDLADLQQGTDQGFVLEVVRGGAYRKWPQHPGGLETLSDHAIVYVWDGQDTFVAKGESKMRPAVPGLMSWFERPAFNELQGALNHYKLHLVKTSFCSLFREAWFDKKSLLFFRARPEEDIRRSLEQHLVSTLRDADVEVRPEQIVDESHPVDIKVTFQFSNRVALLEVKWLGKSKHADGRMATEYTEVRARDGAKQLAGYLDMNRPRAPLAITKGFLIVIDGRRRGLKEDSIAITKEDGFYYSGREIEYEPAYHEERDDFEIPLRMFAEPICNG